MKHSIFKLLFVALFIGFGCQLFAQQAIISGIYTLDTVEYRVASPSEYGTILISRTQQTKMRENRTIVNDIPLDYIRTRMSNEEVYKQIVKDVLGSAKVNALKNAGEQLNFYFYFEPTGKILNLDFNVKAGTLLTLNDIANIDRALREKYTATFTSINNGHQYLYWIANNGRVDFRK